MNQQSHPSQQNPSPQPTQPQPIKPQTQQTQPDNFIYEPPTQQQYQYKIYINDCDRYIPSQLVETFRNDHIIQSNPNIIISSRSHNSLERQKNLIIQKEKQFSQKMQKWQRQVQLIRKRRERQLEENKETKKNQQNQQDEAKIKQSQVKQQHLSNNIQETPLELPPQPQPQSIPQFCAPDGVNTIIDVNLPPNNIQITSQRLYNSVLLQADIILFQLRTDNIQEFQYILKLLKNANVQKEKKIICISSLLSWGLRRNTKFPIQINSQGFTARNPINYHLKQLENLCLALHHQNNMLKGSVVFSGIAYGLGEDQLFGYFKRALQQDRPLQVYGKGSNTLPLIHVEDLCNIVYQVVFSNFNEHKNWHFACDNAKLTQRQLIQSIANNLGNGQLQQKPIQQCFHKQNFDLMTLDMQITQKFQFQNEWTSQQGFIQNIQSIISEFNQYRGLKANKILIIGPPVSGKTTIAQNLQKNYGLPLIGIQKLIEDVKSDQSQFGKEIQSLLEELKVQRVQEERKLYEEMKKKKKGKGVEEFDPEKVVPRLSDDQLVKVIKWRLKASDCQNKGYILDSVIKNVNVAQQVFTDQNHQIIDSILPNSVFVIKATQQQIKQRVKNIPPQKAQNTHWNQQGTTRRYQAYLKNIENGSVESFFEGKVDVKQAQINYEDPNIFSKFVQRNGPLGFKKEVQEPVVQEKENEGKQEQDKNAQPDQQQEEQQQEQLEEVQNEQFNLQRLTQKQQKILNQKSRPIRQYLIDNVIPQITEGLLQICKDVPEDPIDFLIQFLESKNESGKGKS